MYAMFDTVLIAKFGKNATAFSIVFKYRKVDLWFPAIVGNVIPVRADSM